RSGGDPGPRGRGREAGDRAPAARRQPLGLARAGTRIGGRRRRGALGGRVGALVHPVEVTRIAAVDLGTNTTRLLVADVADGALEGVERRERITRLGESVDRRRLLLPTAIARVRNCLVDYRRTAERLGAERVLAVATSAVRDAENGEAFLGEIEWSYGFTTRLLDGDGEALRVFRGICS